MPQPSASVVPPKSAVPATRSIACRRETISAGMAGAATAVAAPSGAGRRAATARDTPRATSVISAIGRSARTTAASSSMSTATMFRDREVSRLDETSRASARSDESATAVSTIARLRRTRPAGERVESTQRAARK